MALDLGISLAEVDATPARDRARWRVYRQNRPRFDPWYAMAMQCVVGANAFGGKAKFSDFYPKVERRRRLRVRARSPEATAKSFESMFGVG